MAVTNTVDCSQIVQLFCKEMDRLGDSMALLKVLETVCQQSETCNMAPSAHVYSTLRDSFYLVTDTVTLEYASTPPTPPPSKPDLRNDAETVLSVDQEAMPAHHEGSCKCLGTVAKKLHESHSTKLLLAVEQAKAPATVQESTAHKLKSSPSFLQKHFSGRRRVAVATRPHNKDPKESLRCTVQ